MSSLISPRNLSLCLCTVAIFALGACTKGSKYDVLHDLSYMPKGYGYNLKPYNTADDTKDDDANADNAGEEAVTTANEASYVPDYSYTPDPLTEGASTNVEPYEPLMPAEPINPVNDEMPDRPRWQQASIDLTDRMTAGTMGLAPLTTIYVYPSDLLSDREKDLGHVLREILNAKGVNVVGNPKPGIYTLHYRIEPFTAMSDTVIFTLKDDERILAEISDIYPQSDLPLQMSSDTTPSAYEYELEERSKTDMMTDGPTPLIAEE